MIPILTVAQMKALEKEADKKGLTYSSMMHNAGSGLAEQVHESFANLEEKTIIGLVGPGNNGGDTLIALTWLKKQGWQTNAYLVKKRPESDQELQDYYQAGGHVLLAEEDTKQKELENLLAQTNLLLDGIFGTGIQLPFKPGLATDILKTVSQTDDKPYVIAVDCPSGVDCDSGQVAEETIPADWTICMAAVKQGMLLFPAFEFIGELSVVDIGLTEVISDWYMVDRQLVTAQDVHHVMPTRPLDAHKGSFGTALVVAGSVNYIGAAYLAGKAAYRIGAGLVNMAVPHVVHSAIAGRFIEAVWTLLPESLGVINKEAVRVVMGEIKKVNALLLGPGWGQEQETALFLKELLVEEQVNKETGKMGFVGKSGKSSTAKDTLPPLVIDADALKLLVKIPDWHKHLPEKCVLTPHLGEMAVLTNLAIKEIQADRQSIAEKYAKQWGCVVVLKGALTIIAGPEGKSAIIPVATSALAKAGTGDVLAGMLVGLLAQGMDAFQAAWSAAWLHAYAGLNALEYIGHPAAVLAGDVLDAIPEVLGDI